MPKLRSSIKTDRLYVRLPVDTIDELQAIAEKSGMYEAHFFANALVLGVRVLARQLEPERYMTTEQISAMSTAMAESMTKAAGITPEKMQELMRLPK